ncbi:MAG: Gldg family protein [Deltaproteobacteria bacterium]|nr:Gldg family protein [Deltaproteobacteria bacterium]
MVRIHKAWPTAALAAGLFALFLGERVYSGGDTARFSFAAIAAALLGAATVVRLNDFLSAPADKKAVLRKLAIATALVTLGAALYALIPAVFSGEGTTNERMRAVLWAVWPITMVLGLIPVVAIETAVAPVAFIERYELGRVERAYSRGVALALFLCCLFFANYLASRHDGKFELSAANLVQLSDPTRTTVRDLTKPVRVILFFPKANEVAETVLRYLEPIQRLSANVTVERVDHALSGPLAKEADVTENGFVVVMHEKTTDKIRLGTQLRSAKSSLRRLDQNFLKALIKVTSQKKVAYFIGGHGERATDTPDKEDQRSPAKLIKKQLEAWQYTVKPLTIADGLGAQVPKDAALIVLLGPEKALLPAELETLKAATEKGLRLLVALEGERDGQVLAELLGPLGLKFDKTILGNERANAPLTRTSADVYSVYSNKYSSHESVTTMTRNSGQLVTLFGKTGSLEKVEEGKLERVKTDLVITALEDTFRDLDGDLVFDPTEKKELYGLAAAVTRTSTTSKKEDETRIFVLADADVFSDALLGLNEGNLYLFRDVVLWLSKSEEAVAPTVAEEDVKIKHMKDEDSLIFYGTTFGFPGLVLGLGWVATRRRRKS